MSLSDDRPVPDATEQLAQLTAEFADFRTTVLARLATRPTGDIEPTVRNTAKVGTLLLQGQAVNRADYPVLWQWAQDQGLVIAGLFTVGNGSTTFGLPDFRGRVPIGVGTLGSDTYALGALIGEARHTLTESELGAHDHTFTFGSAGTHDHGGTNSTGSHSHGGSVDSAGSHGGHISSSGTVPAGSGALAADDAFFSSGSHSHGITTSSAGSHAHDIADSGSHTHSLDIDDAGGGAAHENRQPSIAINWLIYT